MIRYNCGKCGARLESDVSMAGLVDRCPSCGADGTVPQPANRRPRLLAAGGGAMLVVIGIVAAIFFRGEKQAESQPGASSPGPTPAAAPAAAPAEAQAKPAPGDAPPKPAPAQASGRPAPRRTPVVYTPPPMARRPTVDNSWAFDANEAVRRQDAAAKTFSLPRELSLDLGNGVAMKLMLIPPGKFVMGSPSTEEGRLDDNEGPQHEVTITKPYYMGVYTVTQEQYERVTGENPSYFKGATCPVATIAWMEAKDFTKKISQLTGKRVSLPSEAQWEYACRAGSKARYHFGDDNRKLVEYAWFANLVADEQHDGGYPVGQKKPNPWGLYDMCGNVMQYCADWFADYAEGPATDPTGPVSGSWRVLRGSGWSADSGQCRSAIRYRVALYDRSTGVSFRVVVSPGSN
jgi:formylglycine-generating enzyme required for sulfatase activity